MGINKKLIFIIKKIFLSTIILLAFTAVNCYLPDLLHLDNIYFYLLLNIISCATLSTIYYFKHHKNNAVKSSNSLQSIMNTCADTAFKMRNPLQELLTAKQILLEQYPQLQESTSNGFSAPQIIEQAVNYRESLANNLSSITTVLP